MQKPSENITLLDDASAKILIDFDLSRKPQCKVIMLLTEKRNYCRTSNVFRYQLSHILF